jgi:hypothetical protein
LKLTVQGVLVLFVLIGRAKANRERVCNMVNTREPIGFVAVTVKSELVCKKVSR